MSNWGEGFAEGDSGVYQPGNAVRIWNDMQEVTKPDKDKLVEVKDNPARVCGEILGLSVAIAKNKEHPIEARNVALANALNALKYAVELAVTYDDTPISGEE